MRSKFPLFATLLVCAYAATSVSAQNFPSRPVRIIVPYAPGGAVDTVARTVGGKLSELWGQSVVIENRPGGAANIGTELAAHAAPDGYTLLMGTTANGVNLHLLSKMSHDFQRDFAPISLIDTFCNVQLVHASFPARSVKELIALAKSKPDELNYASAGVASSKRSLAAPQIPTIAEAGLPGYELEPWHGILAPAGTPKAVITKIHGDVVKALAAPEIRSRLLSLGIDNIIGSTPEELARFVRAQMEKYGKLVKAAGIQKQ